jgi:hypothetical protein
MNFDHQIVLFILLLAVRGLFGSSFSIVVGRPKLRAVFGKIEELVITTYPSSKIEDNTLLRVVLFPK